MWSHMPTAEDEAMYPGLTQLVIDFMVHKHTPSCMRKGSCRWKYPQKRIPYTHRDERGTWHTWRHAGDE